MAWTSDLDFGSFDLQVKLGLVLLPIGAAVLVHLVPGMMQRSMLAFTVGTVLSMVLGLVKAWSCFAVEGQPNCFSQSTLSFELHPSYAAWYGCWCAGYWGHQLLMGQVADRRIRTFVLITLPFVLLFTVMLASKSGIIGLGAVMLFLGVLVFVRLRGKGRVIVLSSALLAVTIAIFSQGALVKARMITAVDAFGASMQSDPGIYTSEEGSAMRMVAWTCSLERLRAEPWGAGTGDIKHSLMECYVAKGANEAAKRRLNSHDQFLQSAVALGWPGLVLCILMTALPLWLAWRGRDMLLAMFAVLFLLNAAVESVLEVQAGVVFFALFLGLLATRASSRLESELCHP